MKIGKGNGIDLGLESRQFTMKTNAKAFAILSSGLYSNKVRAVIRELSCNAHDSHIEAGNEDRAFDVQLPSYSNTQFFVRDYGTGLSEEEIYNVYTTYFESTKSDSNDYTGALGLGSKSPFCIADSFTIEAFKDGVHRTFMAFIGKEGMPELSKLSETETNEPNGLKVTVDVSDSFYKWADEAADLFAWFPVTPNVICEDNFSVSKIEGIADLSDTVKVLSSNSLKYSERLVITQGTVVYPVTSNDLTSHFGEYDFLTDMYLQVTVPIGTVDITASRESISFVDYTVENLTKKFEEIKDLLISQIDGELSACNDNPWQIMETVKRLRKAYPEKLIKKSTIITNHELYSERYGVNFETSDLKYIDKKQDVLTVTEYNVYNNKIRTNAEWKRTFPHYSALKFEANVHVVVNNETRGMLPTLRLYAKEHEGLNKIILIDFVNRKKYNTRVVNSVLKDLQNPATVLFASKMKRPASNTSTGTPGQPSKDLTVKIAQYPTSQYDAKWHKRDFKIEDLDKMYFVDLDNHTILDNDYYCNLSSLANDIKSVVPSEFFTDKKVCGMTKTQKKRFAKAGIEVKSLFTLLAEYINELDLESVLSSDSAVDDAPNFIQNTTFRKYVTNGLCEVPEIVELSNMANVSRNRKTITFRAIRIMVRNLKLDVDMEALSDVRDHIKGSSQSIRDFAKDIYNVCPMAEHFNPGYYEGEKAYKHLIEYINTQYA